jgi:hypothetical protein
MQPFYLVVLAASAARTPSHDAARARRACSGHHPPGALAGIGECRPATERTGAAAAEGPCRPPRLPRKTFLRANLGERARCPDPGKSGRTEPSAALLTAAGRAWQVGLARSVWGRGRADHAVRTAPGRAFMRVRGGGRMLRRRLENPFGASRDGHTPARLRPPTCRPVNVWLTTPAYGSIRGARVGEIR